ncbi:MAG: HpcH/HpaI aldolase/citrate lyase family protein [Acidaminococcaceae bacterium]|nr:HpcH/HpaI aldolase/citrate lyase family protein [Acidaminococcaceae bacterium]
MNSLYRTLLFVPGNNPSQMVNSEIYGADSIIYDLEDAVSVHEKDAARDLVRHFLMEHRPSGCRVGIRINGQDTPYYDEDVRTMIPLKPDFLRLPKSETAEDIRKLDVLMTECEKGAGIEVGSIKIIATIETALGVYNAFRIAKASARLIAIGLGAEDFRTDMHMTRSEDAQEILFARNLISLSAHAAGVLPLDYVFSNFKNTEGFLADVKLGKMLGFTGKSVIHPSQIPIVHSVYTPTDTEIETAKNVVAAYKDAMEHASGVIQLNGKMIDMPIVVRAQNTLEQAKAAGKEVE